MRQDAKKKDVFKPFNACFQLQVCLSMTFQSAPGFKELNR